MHPALALDGAKCWSDTVPICLDYAASMLISAARPKVIPRLPARLLVSSIT
jgi:hypothetical protein